MSTYSVQDCLKALEDGYRIVCYDLSTLHKRPNGEYVYTPFLKSSVVAIIDNELTSLDLSSLLAVVVLREASIDPNSAPANAPLPVVVAGDIVEGSVVPYKEKETVP